MHPSLISYFFKSPFLQDSFHKTAEKCKGIKKINCGLHFSPEFSDKSKMRRIPTEITNLLAEERRS